MRALLFIVLLFVFVPPVLAEEIYICPMHPHIHGEAGESCPICGMALVPKSKSGSMSMPDDMPENAIHINPAFIQALGIKTDTVTRRSFGHNIRAYGEIVPSTRSQYVLNMRTEGWIVDLATDAAGDTVKKGDLLFTYYSPDLMSAQSDNFIGTRVGNAKERMQFYGMDEQAIALLEKKGRFLEATPFHAPMDGTVVTLNVRKGSFVEKGGLALTLQDFSTVWVSADVPLRDLEFLAEGQKATIIVPEIGKTYESTIDFIHPVADPQTRTGNVRLVVPHENLEPKPGTYVDVVFDADSEERLAVPAEAILYGGNGAVVFESPGDGMFRPVMVETGITTDGLTEITSGLEAGQTIVTSGQFMIDAESNLRSGRANMGEDTPNAPTGGEHVH